MNFLDPPAPEITTSEAAAALAAGAILIDVREPSEFDEVHVPEAKSMPLGEVLERTGEIDGSKQLLVICAHGSRSMAAAGALRQAGYEAVSVGGGTALWAAEGRPVAAGPTQ